MSSTLKKPSHLLDQVKIDCCSNWTLLKFTRPLQIRQETLLDKRSQQDLTSEESAELDAIQELDTIFNFLNHQMAYQRQTSVRR